MTNHSIIFIDHSEHQKYQRFDKSKKHNFSYKNTILEGFYQTKALPLRIYSSFIPPIFGEQSKIVYIDIIGPLFAVIILGLILHCGHISKHPLAVLETSPFLILALYSTVMPLFCFLLAKLGNSQLGFFEIISLLGYGLYGHIFTLISCYIIDKESNDFVFFLFMIIFGGLSGLRIVIVMLFTIPKPAARLTVCSFITILHLLFLVFIHFAYMHRTFKYGSRIKDV